MPFPFKDYDVVVKDCRAIVEQRDSLGRNDHVPFYETRCHGAQDMSGECWQRITRIIGAEKRGAPVEEILKEAVDLVNEAIFHVMFLRREAEKALAEVIDDHL